MSANRQLRSIFLSWFVLCGYLHAKADVTIQETVTSEVHNKPVRQERKIYLAANRLRIDITSDSQQHATLIDLDAQTMTQVDLVKRTGTTYSIPELAAYVATSAEGSPIGQVNPSTGDKFIAGLTCTDHPFEISLPAYKSIPTRLLGTGTVCLSTGGAANQEYAAFAKNAIKAGVILNYYDDNGVFVALAREQTELYKLFCANGDIPLREDLTSHFEHGIAAAAMNRLSSHTVILVTNISTEPIPPATITVPASIKLSHKNH